MGNEYSNSSENIRVNIERVNPSQELTHFCSVELIHLNFLNRLFYENFHFYIDNKHENETNLTDEKELKWINLS